MTDATRAAAAVVFLSRDEAAQRLALAWSKVDRSLSDRARLAAWAAAAGVSRSVAERVTRVLLLHGICKEDGSLDGEASRVLAHAAAAALRAQGGRR